MKPWIVSNIYQIFIIKCYYLLWNGLQDPNTENFEYWKILQKWIILVGGPAWQLSVDSSGGSDKYLFPSLGVDPNIVTVYCGPVTGWWWIVVRAWNEGPSEGS